MGLGRWLVRTVWRMTIDPASFEPVYRQLARILRDQIRSGELRAGATVGSEASLSQRFGVGRDAVRDALAALRSEGLVITERGMGTFVRGPPRRLGSSLRRRHDPVEPHRSVRSRFVA
jgi:DNA-binding GntR family transcriptional regulator